MPATLTPDEMNNNYQAELVSWMSGKQRYQKPLLRYAFKVCNDKEIAQDAVQDAWIKFAKSLRKLDDPRALRSWLYKLVHWRVIDLIRTEKRYISNEEIIVENQCNEKGGENYHAVEKLSLAINRIPSMEKQIIHLFYLDEMKISEIAVVLNIPQGTVKSRLKRAGELLGKKFY